MSRRPDLLLLIAIWMFLSAALAVIGVAAISIFALPYTWDVGGIFGLSIALLVLVCYSGISVIGGIGLLQGREWGRILGIIHAALSLFSIPFGTVIGVLCLVYLTKPDVREYFQPRDTL